jgi:hypothetical protein
MFDVLEAQKRRPAMKKISTMQVFSNEIFKEQKLTIGVDLGDRWSFYCVLDEAGKIILETESVDDTGSDEADIWKDTAKSDRTRNRNPFPLGKPTVNRAGTRSDRGARTKSAIDHQEQSER